MNIPSIRLADGKDIPQIGLGLWQVTNENEFKTAFDAAIKYGYRHFDSAQAYRNEQMLGQAIKDSGLKREQLFITTKIAVQHFGDKSSRKSIEESLRKLDMDYVDLLLLHFPVTGLRKSTWKVAEETKKQGLAKSIGVSNYTIKHLKQLESYAEIMPAVDQVEMHIFLQQQELNNYCREQKIVIEAYSPLAHAKEMDNDLIKRLAEKYNKSYAQIMLRWAMQRDVVVIPKSVNPERIKENMDILDFELSEEDMEQIKQLNQDMHTCWNPELVP